jgi:hypothetical protein
MTLIDSPTALQDRPERVAFWLTNSDTSYTGPQIGGPFYFHAAYLDVTTGFDASAALTVGDSDDPDGYITSITLTSGLKSPTKGAYDGYNAGNSTITCAISNSPTTGKALVILEFFRVPRQV